MIRRLSVASMLLAWTAGAGLAFSQEVLKAIPEEALGFVVVNRLQDTNAKLEKILASLHAPVSAPLALVQGQLGISKGLDEKRGAALVFMPARMKVGNEAQVVGLVPVTNYKEFISQLDPTEPDADITEVSIRGEETALAARKGTYAAIASRSDRAALERLLKSKHDISASVKPLAEWLGRNEVSAVITPAGIKKTSEKALEGLKALTPPKAAAAGRPLPAGAMPALDPAVNAMAVELFRSLPAEISHAALGLRVDASSGLHLAGQALLLPGGKLAQEAKTSKTPEGDLFRGIPAEPFVFAWAANTSGDWSRNLMKLSTAMMKMNPMFGQLDEEKSKELAQAMSDTLAGVQRYAGIWGVTEDDESMYARFVFIMNVDDSAANLANYEKAIRTMNDIFKEQKPVPFSYDVKRGKLDDLPTVEFTTESAALMKGMPPGMAKKMFGADGKLTTYLVAVDAKTIVAGYDKKSVRKAIENYRKGTPGLNSDPNVAITSALLLPGAPVIVYISPHGVMALVKSMMTSMGAPFGGAIPDLAETPPLGFAAKVSPKSIDFDLVVPNEVFQAIGDTVNAMNQQPDN